MSPTAGARRLPPLGMGEVPRRFLLDRRRDPTGLSGTGIVATGICFSWDGPVVTRWRGLYSGVHQITHWSTVDEVLRVHGHGGATDLIWLD
jgi:hypothetical protein